MRNPFWQTINVLWQFRLQLIAALIGAGISAACFGAGLSMLMPTISLLLTQGSDTKTTQHVREQLQSPDAPPGSEQVAQWLATHPYRDPRPPLQQFVDDKFNRPSHPKPVRDGAEWVISHLPTDPLQSFIFVMITIGTLTIIGSIGRYIHELLIVTVVLKTARIWRSRVFDRLIHSPVDLAAKQGYSDNVSRLISDTAQMANGYNAILGKTTAELLKGAAALGVALMINVWLTLLALISAPIIAILLRKFGKRIRRAASKAMKERGRMLGMLNEALSGLAVVKSHDAEGYERRRFHRLNRDMVTQQMKARQAKALASPVVESLALFAVLGVASISAWLIYRQGFAPQDFIVVLASLAAAGASVRPLSTLNNDLSEAGAAASRVLEALKLPVEPIGVEARGKQPELPPHTRDILFDAVSYQYPGKETPALDQVTLHVKHGQTIAVVGTNGAGKTTLLSLIPRLLTPSSGRVLVDGTDIANVDLRSLRKQIALVSQNSTLFEGTIAQNIAYGFRHGSMEQIEAAAKAAFADEFVQQLPQGYQTKLGEGGSGLSGGQRQRLCIARAILRDPSILILDEATSQIDADSEAKISQALATLRRGRTTFIIAHRLSTVVDADLIVVMSQGQISDMGTHAQLLGRSEIYGLLTRTQLRSTA